MKLYPSKLTFAKDGVLDCEYNSACIRYQFFMEGRKTEINPKYMEVGAKWEEIVERKLKGREYKRELPVSNEVLGVTLSGRLDYLAEGLILECKGSFGKSFYKQVILEGRPKVSHLSQIATYFLIMEHYKAKLLAGFFTEDLELKYTKYFKINLSDSGDILVDKVKIGRNIQDLLDAIVIHKNQELNRPLNALSFNGPCRWCEFKLLCLEVDCGLSMEEAKLNVGDIIDGKTNKGK